MNFAGWSRMSPRDRMLAGLSGQMMPTHGLQVMTARGVKLGIAPLAGLGLVNASTMKTDAAVAPTMQYQPAIDAYTPTGGSAPVTHVNLLSTRAGSMLSPAAVQARPGVTQIGPVAPTGSGDGDTGSGRNTNNSGDYDSGGGGGGSAATNDDWNRYASQADDVAPQQPIAKIEDAQKANVQSLATSASVFDTVPKWVWPVGLVVVAWFVFKK